MSRSRARLAADWFGKLRQNSVTQEVEHEDVIAAEEAAAAEAAAQAAEAAARAIAQAEVDAAAAAAQQAADAAAAALQIELDATKAAAAASTLALQSEIDAVALTSSSTAAAYTNTAIANLVATAPATLDTLNELSAALGDDPNFATTVTNNIATKVSKSGDTMTNSLAINANGASLTLNDTSGNPTDQGIRIRAEALDASLPGGEGLGIIFEESPTNGSPDTTPAVITTGEFYAQSNQKVFHDNYRPKADKLTTARNIALTGAVTGSVSFDGSGNVSLATTATSDPTLTLSGDASGSATFTNLGNATLAVNLNNVMKAGADIPSGANLNTYRTTGYYAQNTNTHAAAGSNYPESLAGILEVVTDDTGDGLHTLQRYAVYNSNNVYVRYYYGGTWQAWEQVFNDGYHPNADKLTTARNIALAGDVTGSANFDGSGNISITATVADDSHSHSFNNLTGKESGTGEYSTDSHILAGRGSGAVSLSINDGYGNASVAFNHHEGIPDVNGSALRIETNVDSNNAGEFVFEASSGPVTAGTAVTLTELGTWSTSGLNVASGTLSTAGSRVFADNYHPNADKLTTARNIALAGDVTGSANFDGSGNISITAIVANDSHNHNHSDGSFTVNGVVQATGGANIVSASSNPFRWQRGTLSQTGQDDNVTVHLDDSKIYFTHNNDDDGDSSSYNFRYMTGGSAVNLLTFNSSSIEYKSQNIFHDGYHPNADKWTTARTLSLSGDVTGSTSWDGSGNASISVTVANDSHTHDGRYYTETESDSRFVNTAGDTMTGDLSISNDTPVLSIEDTGNGAGGGFVGHIAFNNSTGESFRIGDWLAVNETDGPDVLRLRNSNGTKTVFEWGQAGTTAGSLYAYNQRVFADDYHPNADKWTTARTLSLTGDASGSTTFDGSGNISITATVANDSHTHDGRYYTETEIDSLLTNGTVNKINNNWSNQTGNLTGYVNDGGGNLGLRFNAAPGGTNTLVEDGIAYELDVANDSTLGSFSIYKGSTATGTAGETITWTDAFRIGGNDSYLYSYGQKIFSDSYHPNADTLTTARNIALAGDVTGSANFDGSGNISITATVANDSHTHDGRYYTETEANSRFLRSNAADTFTTLSGTQLNIGSQVQLQESTDRADLLQITGSTATWAGLQIRNSSNEGRWSFMTDGETAGIYNDEDNKWAMLATENGAVDLRHAGLGKMATTASGIQLYGQIDMNNGAIVGANQIIHEGDTNTYMQFHAADQWRVVTGGGERLGVNNSGLTVTGNIAVTGTVDGRNVAADGTKLDGIATGANNYSFPYTITTSSAASAVVQRDTSGDINARLFRSEYDITNSNCNYFMTQVDTASNNYLRPSTPAQVREKVVGGAGVGTIGSYAWLGSPTKRALNRGTVYAGSGLRYAATASTSVYSDNTAMNIQTTNAISGNWRCMGDTNTTDRYAATLFLRIS